MTGTYSEYRSVIGAVKAICRDEGIEKVLNETSLAENLIYNPFAAYFMHYGTPRYFCEENCNSAAINGSSIALVTSVDAAIIKKVVAEWEDVKYFVCIDMLEETVKLFKYVGGNKLLVEVKTITNDMEQLMNVLDSEYDMNIDDCIEAELEGTEKYDDSDRLWCRPEFVEALRNHSEHIAAVLASFEELENVEKYDIEQAVRGLALFIADIDSDDAEMPCDNAYDDKETAGMISEEARVEFESNVGAKALSDFFENSSIEEIPEEESIEKTDNNDFFEPEEIDNEQDTQDEGFIDNESEPEETVSTFESAEEPEKPTEGTFVDAVNSEVAKRIIVQFEDATKSVISNKNLNIDTLETVVSCGTAIKVGPNLWGVAQRALAYMYREVHDRVPEVVFSRTKIEKQIIEEISWLETDDEGVLSVTDLDEREFNLIRLCTLLQTASRIMGTKGILIFNNAVDYPEFNNKNDLSEAQSEDNETPKIEEESEKDDEEPEKVTEEPEEVTEENGENEAKEESTEKEEEETANEVKVATAVITGDSVISCMQYAGVLRSVILGVNIARNMDNLKGFVMSDEDKIKFITNMIENKKYNGLHKCMTTLIANGSGPVGKSVYISDNESAVLSDHYTITYGKQKYYVSKVEPWQFILFLCTLNKELYGNTHMGFQIKVDVNAIKKYKSIECRDADATEKIRTFVSKSIKDIK